MRFLMNKKFKIFFAIIIFSAIFLAVYPKIEINTGNTIYKCSYTDDFSEFEQNQTYNEAYCYNEERDISIHDFNVKSFLCFHVIIMEYVDGDMRETEFILEEDYIHNFLENAEIESNESDINLAELIKDKKAIVGNTRYLGNDYENAIYYTLDGKHDVLYIFYTEDLLIIQVGYSDEGPKFIAYK